jgi:predicted 2-oxoglutarate/Fe(II)-dependent dioxygenase YbiX
MAISVETRATEVLYLPQLATATDCASLIEEFRRVVANDGTKQIRRMPKRIEVPGSTFREMGIERAHESLTKIRARAFQALRKFYRPNKRSSIEFTLLSEMHTGDAHTLHADKEAQDRGGRWVPNHTPWREFAIMIYLNTSGVDYWGGLLCFPELGMQIRPEAGLLVGFPCGHTHQHKVTTIETGRRYSISIWTSSDPARAERWP